ncbi:hypothetical protein CH373_08465 [Leptospira perolatii]|uniref:Uncharacterized protein n=1 Tax=Leptospira perolatii TaxID=2023191 RepID=A0A2M9ZN81_9LEPT|nr:hypothetical protein [Leptospira perolatii]PJZ68694.1 hypothetical protein CH360_14960 [Leptospira perolatii]PJZ73530.1 hypothetical protein CH373_08465 [Leptospira perolatii]
MAEEFGINYENGLPDETQDDFDPSEMSLDEIDSLLAGGDEESAFDFDPPSENDDSSGGMEELIVSAGDEYPDELSSMSFSDSDLPESGLNLDLTDLDDEVHLDEDFDFELSNPLIDAEINRLLQIEEDEDLGPVPGAGTPSWKDNTPKASTDETSGVEDALGEASDIDFGSLDLGDLSSPGEVPPSAFHSEGEPESIAGFSDLDFGDEEEAPISLSETELENIDISAGLSDFEMEEAEHPLDHSNVSAEDEEFVSDDEGPIALSENELDDLLGADSTTPQPMDLGSLGESFEGDLELPETSLEGGIQEHDVHAIAEGLTTPEDMGDWTEFEKEVGEEADEPIALSDDELGNLLSSGIEEEHEGFEESAAADSGFHFGEGGEEESISLPIHELGGLGEPSESPLDSGLDLGDFSYEPEAEISESAHDEDLISGIGDFSDSKPESDFLSSTEEEEPIALSDDELGNLLSSGTEEEAETSTTFASDFMGEEEEEPIALSDDELGDLLSSGTTEEAENTPFASSFTEEEEEEEPIALSDDELGNLLSSGEEEVGVSAPEPDFLAESGEEEPIALSDDELGNLLSSGEEEAEAQPMDFEMEAEEPIALSDDELGDLLSSGTEEEAGEPEFLGEEEGPISLPIHELDQIATEEASEEMDWGGPVASLDEMESSMQEEVAAPGDWDLTEGADEPITLSDEELGNLLSDDKAAMIESEDLDTLLEPPTPTDLDALGSVEEDMPIADLHFEEQKGASGAVPVPTVETIPPEPELLIVLDEYADEEGLSPIEELRKAAGEGAVSAPGAEPQPSQDEMKRILLYLDELLGNLPDDLIREFSRSDYFELYKKLMKQIGV